MHAAVLFFLVTQGAIVVLLRRHASFSEIKAVFAAAEFVTAIVTALWYLQVRPAAPRRRAGAVGGGPARFHPQVHEVAPAPASVALAEKESLLRELAEARTALDLQKKRYNELEAEAAQHKGQLAELGKTVTELRMVAAPLRSLIQKFAEEGEQLTVQLEQERRQHAIEVRALLGKEGPLPVQKSATRASAQPVTPLTSALRLLLACQKGAKGVAPSEWPANEHRELLRRKFFDMVQHGTSVPCAAFSLEHATDFFVSQKIEETAPAGVFREVLLKARGELAALAAFEPYFLQDARLGSGAWALFRVAWENLDDVVLCLPTH